MVELVIALPIFLYVIFAMVGYGGMFTFRQTLSQAATEGARAAAIAPFNATVADRTTRATNAVNQAFLGQPGTAVACGTGGLTCPAPTITSCGGTCQRISITLNYAYATHPRIPVPQVTGHLLSMPTQLTYTASARIQ